MTIPQGSATDKLVVFCTCSSPEEAEKIARGIVERKYAACVNILDGIKSIYRWQSAVEEASECLLVIKTRREVYAHLETEIKRLHSYSVPEIIAVPVLLGSPGYLHWIESETTWTA